MTPHVFISSTSKDLSEGYRPKIIEAVGLADCVPVCMENWDAHFAKAVELCCGKLVGSTHYLGVFAHYRGSPASGRRGKSITEVEFDLACERLETDKMRVFVPKPGSEADLDLRKRARGQAETRKQAQQTFVARVRRLGVTVPFTDVTNLASRVTTALHTWLGGVREQVEKAGPLPPRHTDFADRLAELGRLEDFTCFQQTWERLSDPAAPRHACLLVRGPFGFGHDKLIARCRTLVGPLPHWVTCTPACWSDPTALGLARQLARTLGEAREPDEPGHLARTLAPFLARQDVVLDVRQAHTLSGALTELARGLWRPLAAALPRPTPGRLLLLATFEHDETDVPAGWDALSQPPPPGPDPFDPALPVRLPPLGRFTVAEIAAFLGRYLPPAVVRDRAPRLHEQSRGHPPALYHRLAEPEFWNPPGGPPS